MMEFYSTIESKGIAEFKDRGSRFLAHAFPLTDVSSFKKIIQDLKKEHPKAVHHCFAYRIGITGDVFRASDDGEPSGTAGKPILGQIDSKELTDVLIIVVRYFGGTLLGVPGLINAYKTVSSLVLQTVPAVRRNVEVKYEIHFEYSDMNEVLKAVKQCNGIAFEQELQLFPFIKVRVPIISEQLLLAVVSNLPNVRMDKLI